MLESVQVIKDKNEARFAVIPYEEYLFLKELLHDEERLGDYLDYLHMQQVKQRDEQRHSLADVQRALT